MKSYRTLLFFVVCSLNAYVSASDGNFAPSKKSLARQLKDVRQNNRAQRVAIFGYMRDGVQLATIPEGTRSTGDTSNQRQSPSGRNSVSLPAVATREKTGLKEKTSFDTPSFAPLYKGVDSTLSPSGKRPISLFGRVLAEIPLHPDQDYSKNPLHIDESD